MRQLCLATLILAFALPASAVPVCDVDDAPISRVADADAASEATPPDVRGSETEEPASENLVIPCAMADGGAFGPYCADAQAFLLTQDGVVLCELSTAGHEPVAVDDDDTVRSLPSGTAASSPSAQFAAFSAADARPVRGRSVVERAHVHAALLTPLNALLTPPPVPS